MNDEERKILAESAPKTSSVSRKSDEKKSAPDADEISRKLAEIQMNADSHFRENSWRKSKRGKRLAAIIAVFGVLIIGVIFWLVLSAKK